MVFWLMDGACFLIALLLVRRSLPDEFRLRFRQTSFCLVFVLTCVFVSLAAGWRSWDLTSWSTGQTVYAANVIEPSILLFLFWSTMALVCYLKERRH